jgi:uncharacterized protein
MAKDLIRYDLLVQDALKKVVRQILSDTAKSGLPGEHHFYISFRTDVPGVRLSQRMRDKYPQEMTVVLQHQFWDLGVTEHAFEVGLSFSGVPERLLIPFEAVTGFFDPSVQFGLKFEVPGEAAESDEAAARKSAQPTRGAASEPAETAPKPPAASPSGEAPAGPVAGKSAVPKLPAKSKAADKPAGKAAPAEQPEKADGEAPAAQVVSLDAFRKKS